LPVKILFNAESIKGYEDRLAPGLSVITSVNVTEKAQRKVDTKIAVDQF
jgi:hypothetical protein